MDPRISVVIPTFNRPEKLARALRSCFNQTVQAYEVLVVDNGENPKTQPTVEAVAEEFDKLDRTSYLTSTRFDIRTALATGIEAVQGDWMILLDDDDFLVPDRIAKDLSVISHSNQEAILILHDFLRIDYNSELVWEHRMAHKSLSLAEALMIDNFPPPPAGTWRADAIKKHHPFNIPEGWMTDYDLYASVLSHGNIVKSGQAGYIMDDTRVADRLTANIDKSVAAVELHRARFQHQRKKTKTPGEQIDRRLDQQIAFFAGKSLQFKSFFGPTAKYARAQPKDAIKGIISPLRARFSRWFADQMPEMRGSRTYTLKRFSRDHPSLSRLIKVSKISSEK